MGERSWIVGAACARRLLARGATILDARDAAARRRRPLAGAVPIAWTDFAEADPHRRGLLLDDGRALAAQLDALGIGASHPVLVVGEPLADWGEDGRIVWMLRALGHRQAALVDGGAAALLAGGPLVHAQMRPEPGDPLRLATAAARRHEITRDELRARLGAPDLAILDSRSAAEFAGQRAHGEPRGGHLPSARHLHFRELLAADGRVVPAAQIHARLAALGISTGMEIAAYCTGGVRSAWLVAVLVRHGYRARNYAGSIWEWAAADPATYPLVAGA